MTTLDQKTVSLRDRAHSIADYLESVGRGDEAEIVRQLAGADGATMTSSEAATVLGVTTQTINRWLEKGVLIGSRIGERGNWSLDAASVAACQHRRAQVNRAKQAFEHGSRLDQAAFISGLSAERIAALEDDDDA